MSIREIVQEISELEGCKVYPPKELPRNIDKEDVLPKDLRDFYTICAGADLFTNADFSVGIVAPNNFVLANQLIVGENCEYDISSHWYIVTDLGDGNYVSIDLHPDRLGKCYDSHWDCHAIVGSSMIIANSFTDLLNRLLVSKGDSWYWYSDDFEALGDAYDGIELREK